MIIFRIFIMAFVCVISACATSQQSIPAEVTRVDFPSSSDLMTVRLGESMLKKSKVYTYDALILDEDFSWGDGVFLQKIIIPAQKLKAKGLTKNGVIFTAEEGFSRDALIGTRPIVTGFCIDQTDKTKWKLYVQGICRNKLKRQPLHSYGKVFDVKNPSLTRELVYNGRVNNYIKIIYRELSNNIMRPAFQQDLQYDLNESEEVAFKEVQMKVIGANNKEISYRVGHHFDDIE